LRFKTHDSVKRYYRRNPQEFQRLHADAATPHPCCVFFAATFPGFGQFLSSCKPAAESKPRGCHLAAANDVNGEW
jgi:hypothetical protein